MSEERRVSLLAAARRSRASWRRLRPFLGDARGRLAALVVASIAAGMAEASLLALIATIGTALGSGTTEIAFDAGPISLTLGLTTAFAVGFALTIARALLQAVAAYLPAAMSADAMAMSRRRLFNAFVDASWPVQSTDRLGRFENLMTQHVGQASVAVVTIGQACSSAAMFTTLLVVALTISPPTALLLAVLSLSLFVVMRPLSKLTGRISSELSEQGTEYMQGSQEVVRLAEETQVFGASNDFRARFVELIERVKVPLMRSRFLTRLVPVLYQSLALFVLLLALFIVSRVSSAPLASLAAVVLLLVRSLAYGQELQASLTRMSELSPFIVELERSINRYATNERTGGDLALPPFRTLELRDVTYGYGDVPALSNVTAQVRQGEAIGVVGPSGAGKSTLVQLLLRLRDPDTGALTINDDIDVRDVRLTDWQRAVAHVPQHPQLMYGSVADNIRFQRSHVTDDDVRRAARLAHVHDDIVAMSDGYDTVLDDRASPVSGGQKQRICLARALAARPSILVLDEPTSALDVGSESLVQESLESLAGEMIVFMVAHRMSTLSICDRVMVIVDGRLDAFDRPDVLVETNEYYRDALAMSAKPSGAR